MKIKSILIFFSQRKYCKQFEQSINQILFIARFPLPRVGLFESSISKLAFPFRAIEWIRINYV